VKRVLEINNLTVDRNLTFSLTLPSLRVRSGTILGVAGPNGSGKTTLLEAIAGIVSVDNGEVCLMGQPLTKNLRQARAHLGYIPDDADWFVAELTAREYFGLLATVYGDAGRLVEFDRIHQLAAQLRFSAFDQQLDTLSHGNKKKVQIIAGLMHQPDLIVIDELRNGLDPLAILAAEQLIRTEADRGAAIVAASHDLWWAQRMTDEILLLSDGQRLVQAPTAKLIERYGSLEKLFVKVAYGQVTATQA
jgi:ABC-2 type transport system ATP-binding protein